MKTSTDPVEILGAITRQHCNAMHMIANLMRDVHRMKMEHCYDQYRCPNGELTSARSPEELDAVMGHLIYMLQCEANCGVDQVVKKSDREVEATICEFNADGYPKTK